MKYGVNRKVLLITAGVVWIIAGANILRIGIMTWLTDSQYWLFKIGEATVVFLLFFLFVFKRLYYKHTKRIGEKKKEKNCPFSFFDVKGWIVMVFMITFGITMRSFHILPDAFISVFYTGLSLALMFTGVLFIRYWWINRKGNLFTPPPEEWKWWRRWLQWLRPQCGYGLCHPEFHCSGKCPSGWGRRAGYRQGCLACCALH